MCVIIFARRRSSEGTEQGTGLLIVLESLSALFPYSYSIMGKISLREITKARLPTPESCIPCVLISFEEQGIPADSRDLSVWEVEK